MSDSVRMCPSCAIPMRALSGGKVYSCPNCLGVVQATPGRPPTVASSPPPIPTPPASRAPAPPTPITRSQPPPTAVPPAFPSASGARPVAIPLVTATPVRKPGSKVLLLGLSVGLIALVGLGILALVLGNSRTSSTAAAPGSTEIQAKSDTVPSVPAPEVQEPAPTAPSQPAPLPELPAKPIPPPLTANLPPDEQAAVNKAVDLGVAYLRANMPPPRPGGDHRAGEDMLAGLTLLECGVPENDPVIQQVAVAIRAQADSLHTTYGLSLAILFLDRLKQRDDAALIRTFAERLMGGQLPTGAWTYTCPTNGGGGDNSNTQFALLGLWTARRHNVPVEQALSRCAQYFRSTQAPEGSWAYNPGASWKDSMTCAGLLALAIDRVAQERKGAEDPAFERGLAFLGQRVAGSQGSLAADSYGNLYYLWSLERVCMIYNLREVGGREWYPWGARLLLPLQQANGSWQDAHGPSVDTCFALLFLKRVNVAQDLTRELMRLRGAEPKSR